MFELARTYHWWPQAKKYPLLSNRPNVLKPVGYAHIIEHVDNFQAKKILEIGHGTSSMLFPLKNQECELWGLDSIPSTEAYPTLRGQVEKFRDLYSPPAKFVEGLLGVDSSDKLPSDYFDMICSVSVVEHIPKDALAGFMSEAIRILRPGGLMVHSYDVWLREPTKPMFDAIVKAGFDWLSPQRLAVFWEDWLPPLDGLSEEAVKHQPIWGEKWPKGRTAPNDFAILHQLIIENPCCVAEQYMHGLPRDQRPAPQTYLTVLIVAQKPVSVSRERDPTRELALDVPAGR